MNAPGVYSKQYGKTKIIFLPLSYCHFSVQHYCENEHIKNVHSTVESGYNELMKTGN